MSRNKIEIHFFKPKNIQYQPKFSFLLNFLDLAKGLSDNYINHMDFFYSKKYKISGNESRVEIFLNLSLFQNYKEFLSDPLVANLFNKMSKPSVQKLWDFLYHTSLCECWWKDNYIYSDFLVNINKQRKIYSRDHLLLFIRERLLTFGVLPSTVFDFLGLSSSRKIEKADNIIIRDMNKIFTCKLCKRDIYITELVEHLQDKEGICVYCYNSMTKEERKLIENVDLKIERVLNTWRVMNEHERKKLSLKHLKRSYSPKNIQEIKYLNDVVQNIVNVDNFAELKSFLGEEAWENMFWDIEKSFFEIWWKRVELREEQNEEHQKI